MGRINNRYIFPELHGDRQAQVPVMECSVCGGEIYEGEDYFHVGDEVCSTECVWRDTAE